MCSLHSSFIHSTGIFLSIIICKLLYTKLSSPCLHGGHGLIHEHTLGQAWAVLGTGRQRWTTCQLLSALGAPTAHHRSIVSAACGH